MKHIRIPFEEMKETLCTILLSLNFSLEKAEKCATVFAENSLDGVYSHGINRFSRFVDSVRRGYVNPNKEAIKKAVIGNLEQWDGQLGPGPINALISSDRAMDLAKEYGIGMVALANTNHWMRGGTYGWKCAKSGFAFIGWTNTIANMPPWGAKECKLGNNPFVIAIPYEDEALVLDMAMSQFSYGKMEDLEKAGGKLPLPGGYNNDDELTTNPSEILGSGRVLPIGYWKGSGLSLMLDLLASILSGGLSTNMVTKQSKSEYGVSQVYVAIDLKQLPNSSGIIQSIEEVLNEFLSAETINHENPIRYPGQSILKIREENLRIGIPVNPEIWNEILNLKAI